MASGDTLLLFVPASADYPTSNAAAINARNTHLMHQFDSGTDESVIFPFVLPRHYAGGGLTVYLHWSGETATSGNVVWNAAFERVGDGSQDIDSTSFASVQAVTDAAPGTSGFVTPAIITFTNGQIDGLLVGEMGRIKITRDANNGSDTMSNDAELHRVEIKET